MRKKRCERVGRRVCGWIILVEAVDQDYQTLPARNQLPGGHSHECGRQPHRWMASAVCTWLGWSGKPLLDLCDERTYQLLGIIPAVLASSNEVVRHDGTRRLASA